MDLEIKNIVIFGYSGHSYVVLDAAINIGYNIKSYIDVSENKLNPYELNYLGYEQNINLKTLKTNSEYVFPCFGSNSIRKKTILLFDELMLKQINIIHSKSIISSDVEINLSTFISAGAIINSMVKIGKGCIINTSAIIEHECLIGNYTHIAPGAVLSGNVKVGDETFIGANAVIKQGVKIGSNVVIGAGSVVLKDVPSNETWVGNPAKKMTK